MSEPGPSAGNGWRHAPVLERAGLVLALGGVVTKASVTISAFPGWELDPFSLPAPSSGVGPQGAMIADAVVCLGVVMLLLARHLAGHGARLVDAILALAGSSGVILHLLMSGATIGDTWIGSAWLAAMSGALGAASASGPGASGRRNQNGAIIAAVFLGFVALLAVRGAQQVLIEHPATLADFKRNREVIFAAQGWSTDSPMAKAYERRLSQPEATGWFGLANVYATLAAVGTVTAGVAFLGAVAAYRRSGAREMTAGLLAAGVVPLAACAGGLVLAGAKGGIVAAALGCAAAAALIMIKPNWRRARALSGMVGVGALGATFLLVIARGVVGDRIGELSILFRWFYMEAAVRIGVHHLPLGVGPDRFQGAYTLLKNPLSPEDVSSSHNMLLDWFATLGVFGLAWAVLWVLWIRRAGSSAAEPEIAPAPGTLEEDTSRADRWCIAAVGTLATLVAIRVDRDILSPDLAAARLAGLVVFCGVAWTALALWRRMSVRWARVALTAGAIAGACHALIDVTGVWPGACAMLALLVGAAAGPGPGAPRRRWPLGVMAALAPLVVVACLIPRVQGWERGLRGAAAVAEESGLMVQRWTEVAKSLRERRPGAGEDAQALAADLGHLTGRTPQNAAGIEEAVRELDLRASREASAKLESLSQGYPAEWKVRREASRAKLREAGMLGALGRAAESREASLAAERMASEVAPGMARNASEWAWIGLVRESLVPADPTWGKKAADALTNASKLAPYELEYALRLMRLQDRQGEQSEAKAWATKVLELDAGAKYDREVKGLSPQERDEARRILGGS